MISVDDHVVEPPDLWSARLPERWRDKGPRVRRIKARLAGQARGGFLKVAEAPDDPGASWVDEWVYEDLNAVIPSGMMQVHELRDMHYLSLVTYDQIPPGIW